MRPEPGSCLHAVRGALLLALVLLPWTAPGPAACATDPGAKGVRTLYLVRHGLYDEQDPRDPDQGKALVPDGREQARLVGARLAGLPAAFRALHASTMTRARETAEIIARALPPLEPQLSRDLRECAPPRAPEAAGSAQERTESEACRERLERAYARYFRPSLGGDSSEVLVCHGNVIRYFVCRALGVEPGIWARMSIQNASLTVIQIRADGSARLISYDDVGHLPPALQTFGGSGRTMADTSRGR